MAKEEIDSPHFNTPLCRLSFPVLVEPQAYAKGNDPAFSAMLIFDNPKAEAFMKIRKIAKDVATQKFGPTLPANFWSPFRPCEEKLDKNYKGFAPGYVYIKAKANADQKITFMASDAKTLIEPQVFYGGCYVIANIHFWPYSKGQGNGLSVRLNGLQFIRDGERFAGRNVEFEAQGVEEGTFDEATNSGEDFI